MGGDVHCIGAEGQHVFGTLGTETKFTEAVELLKETFAHIPLHRVLEWGVAV